MADDLAMLQRWENAGATWRVIAHHDGSATIALCRCDGGEEIERFTSTDRRLLDYLRGDPS
ncbi:hypothetical protein [Acrocarpospora catenulata]|uniref:hypothetical protein n=1 Tax=Acrocarpospora catenulata TaxID=2836182 RepID=UPI001BDB1821|nr:hypothetical protein [Acrocarpospora catenulata]